MLEQTWISKSFLKSRKDCHISAQVSIWFLHYFLQTLTSICCCITTFVLCAHLLHCKLFWFFDGLWHCLEIKSFVTSCVNLQNSFWLSPLHSSLEFLRTQGLTFPTGRRQTIPVYCICHYEILLNASNFFSYYFVSIKIISKLTIATLDKIEMYMEKIKNYLETTFLFVSWGCWNKLPQLMS